MERKTRRSFVSCHCRDIFTRGVFCICALKDAADRHKSPAQWNIWLIYLHYREFILSSFLFLLLLTAVNPASIQCSLLYIGTKVSIRETEQAKYIYKQRKKKRGPKRKQTELIQILHSNNRNNSNQKMIIMREGNADDVDDEVQLILALSRKTLRPLSGSPQDMRICSEECSSAWYVFIFMRKYHRKGYILKEVPSCTSIQIGKGPEEVQKVIGP